LLICALSILHSPCYLDDPAGGYHGEDEDDDDDDEEDPHVTVMIALEVITAPLLSTTFN
jgi:hypothetical protein